MAAQPPSVRPGCTSGLSRGKSLAYSDDGVGARCWQERVGEAWGAQDAGRQDPNPLGTFDESAGPSGPLSRPLLSTAWIWVPRAPVHPGGFGADIQLDAEGVGGKGNALHRLLQREELRAGRGL